MPKIIAQAKVAALKALIKARIKANKEDKEKGKKVRSLIRSLGGGNGLVVRITSNTAYYQIRYSWKGKPKFFTIGKTDLISYPNAKKKCLEYRRMVFNGQDPAIVNKLHILISWSIVSDHWSKGCKINGAGSIFREPALQ